MIVLGIESTAHTFGISLVSVSGSGRAVVLSNTRKSFSTKEGGIVPNKASMHHTENFGEVLALSLETAGRRLSEVGLVSYSRSPGLGHTLRIGLFAAKSLGMLLDVPVIGVNHCIAHLEIGRMLYPQCKDPVLLYASGANTQVIAYDAGSYRIFGETLDIGIGNFLDSFARELGLGFPGGPKIAKLALKGNRYVGLPYVVKGMDTSFGGLLTNLKEKKKSGIFRDEDLAYSAQEAAFAMLVEVTERALAHTGKSELLLGGGVACNRRLQEMARIMCSERSAKAFIPPDEYLVDNAAMIAWLGFLQYDCLAKAEKKSARSGLCSAGIDPYERTDEVAVNWRK